MYLLTEDKACYNGEELRGTTFDSLDSLISFVRDEISEYRDGYQQGKVYIESADDHFSPCDLRVYVLPEKAFEIKVDYSIKVG